MYKNSMTKYRNIRKFNTYYFISVTRKENNNYKYKSYTNRNQYINKAFKHIFNLENPNIAIFIDSISRNCDRTNNLFVRFCLTEKILYSNDPSINKDKDDFFEIEVSLYNVNDDVDTIEFDDLIYDFIESLKYIKYEIENNINNYHSNHELIESDDKPSTDIGKHIILDVDFSDENENNKLECTNVYLKNNSLQSGFFSENYNVNILYNFFIHNMKSDLTSLSKINFSFEPEYTIKINSKKYDNIRYTIKISGKNLLFDFKNIKRHRYDEMILSSTSKLITQKYNTIGYKWDEDESFKIAKEIYDSFLNKVYSDEKLKEYIKNQYNKNYDNGEYLFIDSYSKRRVSLISNFGENSKNSKESKFSELIHKVYLADSIRDTLSKIEYRDFYLGVKQIMNQKFYEYISNIIDNESDIRANLIDYQFNI